MINEENLFIYLFLMIMLMLWREKKSMNGKVW